MDTNYFYVGTYLFYTYTLFVIAMSTFYTWRDFDIATLAKATIVEALYASLRREKKVETSPLK